MSRTAKFDRESRFHDGWAQSTDLGRIDVESTFYVPTAVENRFILERLGDLRGKRLLDIGCGLGESSVMFAKLGAVVTASDLSPQMAALTAALAVHHGMKIETVVGPAEELALPGQSFDVIYAANTIHHLADREAFFRGVTRLLRPGGVFCSWDPLKYNPAINIYRRLATKVRSVDEAPLGRGHLREFAQHFASVQTRHFWFLAQLLFVKYFFWDRVSPNRDRYWKRVYRETARSLWWWLPLRAIDSVVLRLPLLRWLSWNMVVIATKPRTAASSP